MLASRTGVQVQCRRDAPALVEGDRDKDNEEGNNHETGLRRSGTTHDARGHGGPADPAATLLGTDARLAVARKVPSGTAERADVLGRAAGVTGDELIAVEIKSFLGQSPLRDFTHRRLPEIRRVPTLLSVPAVTATTGVPAAAKMSLPSWNPV